MSEDVEFASIWSEPRWRVVIWIVLLGAFSPVLLDLSRHIAAHPWAGTAVVFPWLAWIATRSNPPVDRRPRTSIVWGALIFALVLEIVAMSGAAPRIARVGFVVGLLGVVWGAGWAKSTPALVLIWIVPLPTMLFEILSPGLEHRLGALCARLLPGLEFQPLGVMPSLVSASGESVTLAPSSGGLALLFAFAGLGWFRAAASGATALAAAGRAARWSLIGIPIQALILLAAATALAAGVRAATAQRVLDHAAWIVILCVGLASSFAFMAVREEREEEVAAC